MLRTKTLVSMCALAVLLSCETVVDVRPPPHDPQLVAGGFFTSDSLWIVRVTHSVPYTADAAPADVDGAAVEVLSGGRLIQPLTRSSAGTYSGIGQQPEPGKTYSLRVRAPGFDATQGSDQLPESPHVADFQAISEPLDRHTQGVDMTLVVDDPAGTPNYYGLAIIQSRWQFDRATGAAKPLQPTLFTFESDDPILDDGLLALLDPGAKHYRRAFFNDEQFDGSPHALKLRVLYEMPDPDADVQIWRAFSVVLIALSQNLYEYSTSADRQLASDVNPFAEPVTVHSNMSNGFGVFGGFQYRTFPIPPDNINELHPTVFELSSSWTIASELRDFLFHHSVTH